METTTGKKRTAIPVELSRSEYVLISKIARREGRSMASLVRRILREGVEIRHEARRGCGYRKPGKTGVGIYLRGMGWGEICERLPYPLEVCPTCNGGIKFSRGFTWIRPKPLLHTPPLCNQRDIERPGQGHNHLACIVCNPLDDPAGLMWVGEKFYSPASFTAEAMEIGISKRVSAIPRGFEVGKHWIYLAHVRAVPGDLLRQNKDLSGNSFGPGIFYVFRPTHVELVIADPEAVPDEAERLYDRLGEDKCRIVVVRPAEEAQEVCHAT